MLGIKNLIFGFKKSSNLELLTISITTLSLKNEGGEARKTSTPVRPP